MPYAQAVWAAERIAALAAERGGRAYYVGGYVRDKLRGEKPHADKDIDIEVHGIAADELSEIVGSVGTKLEYGASFGILSLSEYPIDIAIPRSERAFGNRHVDFDVTPDPFIGVEAAASRRDFTVNAIMEDVLTGEIIDLFGGQRDLKDGIIRHVSAEKFSEDPLRVLRCAQFAARFDFKIAPETLELCSGIDLSGLSRERVEDEMKKALTMAQKPSLFFESLRRMNQLSVWFPELEALIGVEQNPRYHSEGDVWTHTMLVLDQAAKRRHAAEEPYYFMLSALCHDFGKKTATSVVDGVIHAYRHAEEGLPPVSNFLRRLTDEKAVHRYVLNMVEHHMKPNVMAYSGAAVKSTNKLFDCSVSPSDLVLLALSDNCGKVAQDELVPTEDFLYERLRIFKETMSRPCVTGDDLISAGLTPGEGFKELLDYSHKLRLAGIEKKAALRMTLSYAQKKKKEKNST